MTSRISSLLRTNTALILLCIISVGVLALLARGPQRSGEINTVPAKTMVIDSGNFGQNKSEDGASGVAPAPGGIPASSPFKNMPAPATFHEFIFHATSTLAVQLTCSDVYSVVMVFPKDVDYRSDILSAKYNAALPCTKGVVSTSIIDLSLHSMKEGESYYFIRAQEGTSGLWHDPY